MSASSAAALPWEPKEPPISTPWTDQVGPDNALPEYPRPQLTRPRWVNLNGVWQFAPAADGDSVPSDQDLDERILVPYPVESALSGIMRSEERMWYRRTFDVPAGWHVGRDERLILHFGAVDYDAKVWVNGELVTTHRGGYDGFDVDVTDALTADGPQELIVWAEDLTDRTWQPIGKQRQVPDRGIFYQGSSGIWRTVWMEPVPAVHVTDLDMTPDLDASALRLTVHAAGATEQRVEAVALDGDRAVGRVTGRAGDELALPVPDPKLWSPDSPFLYDLRVRVLDGRRTVDQVKSYFGMREIGMVDGADGRPRIALNGKILFNLSTLDQGFWPDGLNTAPTDEALRFDLEQHKVLGFNTVRKHIKVEPDRWYYWADRLGLMVWQDMPASKTGRIPDPWREQFESELHEMIREHDSWTSIVAWVPFNEGWGEWDRDATGRIARQVKAQDPSRLVNAHSGVNCCDSLGDPGEGDVIDFHQYVGPATPVPDDRRVAIDGEHGGFGLEVEGHMWFGEGHAYEMTDSVDEATRRYVENQRDLLDAANTCGLSGGIYTQITDVEHEVNGFFTYDRQVEKMHFDQVRAINEEIIDSVDCTSEPPSYPPGTPGLTGLAYWPADEGDGTTAADQVGDADLALSGGATWTNGQSGTGTALQFDGSSGYAETARPVLDTSGHFTVSAWVRLDRLDGWRTALGQDGDVQSAFFLQKTDDTDRFAFSTAGGRALSTFTPEADRWYHLVGVRDAAGGRNTLYVDGVAQGSVTECLMQGSAGPLSVGRARFGGADVDFWPGAVDDVRVWDRALSATEVADLYASGG
ncbi:MAG TPA: LamG-like jellyroll fold domain-containing protein [Nocardioidaceae bacterium]|nr:LamG-like jellyroll fold domain-containing protein [Nocardioidaceae bacterium]